MSRAPATDTSRSTVRGTPHCVAEAARFGYLLLRGYRKALRYLRRENAAVVVGLGSFASVPTALAAALRRAAGALGAKRGCRTGESSARQARNCVMPQFRGDLWCSS